MVKRLVYIGILLLFMASPLSASFAYTHSRDIHSIKLLSHTHDLVLITELQWPRDTIKVKSVPQSNHMDVVGKRIKEVAKPKHQSKPEKVVTPTTPASADTAAINKKAKRQRRPEGLERPPEIPRRGGN